jgi:hypothetical protein
MIDIIEFKKDISIYIPFDTDKKAFGKNKLLYFSSKHGRNKDTQKQEIIKEIKHNINQLQNAITKLEEEE